VRIKSSLGPRRAAALLVASAAVMLVAACGGGSDKASGTGGGTGGGTGQGGGTSQALTAYVDCMKQNGVTITLPSFAPRTGASRGPGENRPSGQPRPRPSGSFGGGGRGGFGGGAGGFFQKPAGVDDATWQKAQTACASSLPSRGPGGGGFGGNGGQNSAYRNCLQQHGVTMNGGRPASADPKTQQALKTCSVLRQSASPTPSS
jgi:hypothetical protein